MKHVPQVLSLKFDTSGTSVAVGLENGFKVCRCEPFAKCFEVKDHGTLMLALPSSGSTVARVVARKPSAAEQATTAASTGSKRLYPRRSVLLHDLKSHEVHETEGFPTAILAIHMESDVLFTVLEHEIHILHCKTLPPQKIKIIATAPNPRGLMAYAAHQGILSFAYPLQGEGNIAITEINTQRTPFLFRTTCNLSVQPLNVSTMAFSEDGSLLVVASKVKDIKVIDVPLQRFAYIIRRGLPQAVAPTEIETVCISPNRSLLCVSSRGGCVNIYTLSDDIRVEDDPALSPRGGRGRTTSNQLKSGGTELLSAVSQVKEYLQDPNKCKGFSWFDIPKKSSGTAADLKPPGHQICSIDVDMITVATYDGRLLRYEIDLNLGGEGKLKDGYLLTDDHVWILGERYDLWEVPCTGTVPQDDTSKMSHRLGGMLRFTYRHHFSSISNSNITSDQGWGCMLRTGQMMLAQAFKLHYGGDPVTQRRSAGSASAAGVDQNIANWFCDKPESPYSVHNIAQLGDKKGKPVGNWFSPTLIALVLQELVEQNSIKHDNLRVYVADTATLYFEQIEAINPKDNFSPLLVLIPVMLGAPPLANPIYFGSLLQFFHLPGFLGIVGGKPNASLYFIGYHLDASCQLVYLDPHVCTQQALMTVTDASRETLRESNFLTMPITSLDSSLVLGFYCADRASFDNLVVTTQKIADSSGTPMFTWQHSAPLGNKRESLSAYCDGWRLVSASEQEDSGEFKPDGDDDDEWEEI